MSEKNLWGPQSRNFKKFEDHWYRFITLFGLRLVKKSLNKTETAQKTLSLAARRHAIYGVPVEHLYVYLSSQINEFCVKNILEFTQISFLQTYFASKWIDEL